jgi:hypothetical protein
MQELCQLLPADIKDQKITAVMKSMDKNSYVFYYGLRFSDICYGFWL